MSVHGKADSMAMRDSRAGVVAAFLTLQVQNYKALQPIIT
jgi:hypothetical protein